MKVTVIGSSDAFNAGGRGHSCYLVESAGTGKVMIDFGATALAGLRRQGIEPNALDAIAITHLHGDHVGGYPFLVIDALYNSFRSTKLQVLGPVLTRGVLDELFEVMYGEVKGDLSRLPFVIDEVEPGAVRELAGFTIRTFPADHMRAPHRPLCLRVSDPAGRSVAFSGDTRLGPGLLAAAEGVDLLVAECTRLAPPAGQHCTFQEWQEVLPRLRAKRLLFTHLGLDVRERIPALLAETRSPIPLAFADDGLVLEV